MMIDGYAAEQIENDLLNKTYKVGTYRADSTHPVAPYLEVNESGICKVFGENSNGSVKDCQIIIPKDIFIEAFNRWCK